MSDMFVDAYKGRRVLVTGADGFIGSHLTERLVSAGATVTVLTRGTSVNGTTMHSLRNIGHLTNQITLLSGNLGQPEVSQIVRDANPEYLFHLGAEAYVPKSFEQPNEVFLVNANGTLHILEAARRISGLIRCVCTSSSEIYGTADNDKPISESHPLRPTSPYAASKAAADRLCHAYMVTYDMPLSVIRPFNTFGPRHTYDVIPKFIRLALNGEDLSVHGDGRQSRDFTFVDDTVRGFMLMGCHPNANQKIVNIGSGQTYEIGDVAQRIKALSGSDSNIIHGPARTAEVNTLICDASKANELIGWQPQISFEAGLFRNIEWERERLGR